MNEKETESKKDRMAKISKRANAVNEVVNNFCKKCVFFDLDAPHADCMTGKLDLLLKAENPVGFCLSHRPKDAGHPSDEDFAIKCNEDCKPSFGIMIFDDSDDPLDITKTIESIKKINMDNKRFIVLISVLENPLLERNKDNKDPIGEYIKHYHNLNAANVKSKITIQKYPTRTYEGETEAFYKMLGASYWVSVFSGNEIDPEFLSFTSKKVESMERVILAEDVENNVACIPKSVVSNFFVLPYSELVDDIRDSAKKSETYLKYEKK